MIPMVKILIDEQALEVSEGLTLLRAAEEAGISIPHFCYHPAFAPEGSCRMCVVEIEGLPKLELACSTIVKEGMKVRTKSPKVVEARKSVLEFLLADHPLDCPICDKAGECKLQDYFDEHGLFKSQFKEAKEKREKKIRISRRLILDRERCILCTRCVRFLAEITGTGDAGIVNRGIHSEVSIYESELIDNNYAGNLVDLCPVGAITDADFRFRARVWFLDKKESICPFCSRGCNIFVDSYHAYFRVQMPQRVYRFRPRPNPDVNRYWICDYGRYQYAHLDKGRQNKLVWKKGNRDTELSWEKCLQILAEKMNSLISTRKGSKIAVILNSGLSNEELFLADRIFRRRLHLDNILVVDPPPGDGDGFLLTADRAPNARALQEIGLPVINHNLNELAEKTNLLLIFGHYLAAGSSQEALKNTLDKIETKVLWTSHQSGLDELVDFIIPTPVIAEKSGTLTNVDGKIQAFTEALAFCGDGLPEWKALLDLAKELKIDDPDLGPFDSPEAIYRTMGREIPFFK
jgi:NADH-quinone oxidoreductase subunit G